MDRRVDIFLKRAKQWQDEMIFLRNIVLECDLDEDYKWMHPCYSFNGNNVVLIHEFKDYCALLFHKGVLLSDPEKILVQQTQNVQSARQIRFTNLEQIIVMKSILKAYIKEAIEVERSGVKVEMKETSEFDMPEEFQKALNEMPELKTAFEALTPGRQRGYLLYFSAAKQSKTRTIRIEKYIPQILDGKGLND